MNFFGIKGAIKHRRAPSSGLLLRVLTPLALSISLSGCGATECIDALFPRSSIPLHGSHTFEVIYKGQPVIKTTILCEKYYDAMCSERGNSWRLREIGSTGDPWLMRFVTVRDPAIGLIKIPRPSCELFTGSAPKAFSALIIVNGEFYFYSSENANGYVFIKRDFAKQLIDPATAKSVTIPVILEVDGKPLSPPKPQA